MSEDAQAIGRYIARVPEARRERALALHGLILSLFPQAAASLERRMPTYRLGANFIAWGSVRQHLVVQTCSAERVAGFRARHARVQGARGCLRFRDGERLPLADLAQVVKSALAPSRAMLAREVAKGRR
jgi:uncharacterized protein YdhG (YjbR/CyaY superfamily)